MDGGNDEGLGIVCPGFRRRAGPIRLQRSCQSSETFFGSELSDVAGQHHRQGHRQKSGGQTHLQLGRNCSGDLLKTFLFINFL